MTPVNLKKSILDHLVRLFMPIAAGPVIDKESPLKTPRAAVSKSIGGWFELKELRDRGIRIKGDHRRN